MGYFDLMRDLSRVGCAVCRGASRSARRYIDGLLWEGITDPGIRTITRASHGFCRAHSMMAIAVADQESGQLGMAILFEDLLRHVEREAADIPHAGRPRLKRARRGRQDAMHPHAICRACGCAEATATNYLRVLAHADPSSDVGTAARANAPSLCLPHLRMGLLSEADKEEKARLVGVFTVGTEQLRGELLEFIRKRDYRYASEQVSIAEATSWIRAVHALAGTPPTRSRRRQ